MSDIKQCAVILEQHTTQGINLLGICLVPAGANEFTYCEEVAYNIRETGNIITFDPVQKNKVMVTSVTCGSITVSPFTEGEPVSHDDIKNKYRKVSPRY